MAKQKSAPYLAIKTDFRKDDRFEVLGNIAGYNKYEAFGRMTHLWGWCRDRKLQDAPDGSDGYVVSEAVVCTFLGEKGVKAILAADVDCLALGQRWENGHIYLRGTSETVGALRQRLAAASAGGTARSASPRVHGRYPSSSRDGAENQPTGWKTPAELQPNSSLILPPSSYHQEEDHIEAGASVEPASDSPALTLSRAAVGEINRLASKQYKPETYERECRKLAKDKVTPEQAVRVVRSKAGWLQQPSMVEHFCPKTILRPSNFAKYLDELEAQKQPMLALSSSAANDDEPDMTYAGFGMGPLS